VDELSQMGLLHLLVWQEGFEMLRGRKLLWGGICGLAGKKSARSSLRQQAFRKNFCGF